MAEKISLNVGRFLRGPGVLWLHCMVIQRAALGESSGILYSRARVVREEGIDLSHTSVESV
jgi:hypothetical protein